MLADSLKYWMIMIPSLNKNTAARVASGACCGGKRCRRVSGGQPDRSYILCEKFPAVRLGKVCFILKICGKAFPPARQTEDKFSIYLWDKPK